MASTALVPFAGPDTARLRWLSGADRQRVTEFLGLTTVEQRDRLYGLLRAGKDTDNLLQVLGGMPRWEVKAGSHFLALAFASRIDRANDRKIGRA